MLNEPMDILKLFPVRKTKVQKEAFRTSVRDFAERLGYPCREEAGSFGSKNLIIGDPERTKFLVTAHYDTCARMPIPNFVTPCNIWLYLAYQLLLVAGLGVIAIGAGVLAGLVLGEGWVGPVIFTAYWMLLGLMLLGPANPNNANDNTSGVVTLLEIARTMPENQRNKVCFVLFDLEEVGLIGSASYRKAHPNSVRQLILNLDCVGDGDHLRMFPTKALKKDRKKLTSLYKACGYFGQKDLLVQEKGKYLYPSDQNHFPYGVGICALRKHRKTLYMSRIHTKKDTVLDETNVNILRAALTTFICRDEVN